MKLLVVTESDACCGPMAAAFLNDYSMSMEAVSAGRNPASCIEPLAVVAMKECLIDLSNYQPKKVSDFNSKDFEVVFECPDLLAPTSLEDFRKLRDFIKNEAYLFFRKL